MKKAVARGGSHCARRARTRRGDFEDERSRAAFTAGIVAALSAGAPRPPPHDADRVEDARQGGLGAKFLLAALGGASWRRRGVTGVLLVPAVSSERRRDEEELRDVRRYRLVASVVVVLFAGACLSEYCDRLALLGGRDFVAFLLALAWMQHVWRTRGRRRLEAEMRETRPRTAQRRRERRGAIIGWSLGLTFGNPRARRGPWFSSR